MSRRARPSEVEHRLYGHRLIRRGGCSGTRVCALTNINRPVMGVKRRLWGSQFPTGAGDETLPGMKPHSIK